MPSSWLSSGAGAAQGLEELLTRQRQDEIVRNNMAQHQGTLAETVRSHQAEEALRGRQIDSAEADRGLAREQQRIQQEAQRQNMQATQDNAMRDDVRAREGLRVPGSQVQPEEFAQVQRFGVLPMSAYNQSPGDPLPNGDQGPPLPKIAFTGTQPQLMAQQAETDRINQQAIGNDRADRALAETVKGRQATQAETAAQHGMTNEIAKGNLADRQRRTADAEAERKAKGGEIKLGERAKKDLSALMKAKSLAEPILEQMRAQHPDIEDPNAKPDMMGNRINQKYNTLANRLGNQMDVWRYKAGLYSEDSPQLQMESLLRPIQTGPYMSGMRNREAMQIVLDHMDNPAHSLGERYSRLKTLVQNTPALQQAIVNSERPVKVDASGKIMDRGGGTETSGNGGTKVGRFTVVEEP